MIEILPLQTIGEVARGTDLAAVLVGALAEENILVREQDILVVSQKIVSKAEDRFVDLASVSAGAEATRLATKVRKDPRLIELILAESTAVVRASPGILITRHRSGHVMANAGIDQSNLGPTGSERVLLLPEDPDRSADELRLALAQQLSPAPAPAILISDSFGRPWRLGVVNVAIGSSGFPALVDRRGEADRDGRRLEVTQIGLADLVACAAGLTFGEAAEGIPAAVVRGLAWTSPPQPATALVRPLEEDLFR